MGRKRTIFALGSALLLLAASDVAPLKTGLWEVTNTPGVAKLDGRALNDLPLFEIVSQQLCLTPAEAANPARFLAGDLAGECELGAVAVTDGRLSLSGVCPSPDGREPGSVVLTGALERERYSLAFETVTFGENGKMSFSGKLSGRRIGECPEGGAAS
ncbi:MAG TPA: DUF3617 family protein [Allosphingosinicella sp.]|jgi:hypothetical protein